MDNNVKHFVVMAIGQNHEELMKEYSKGKETEPYVKYRYLDAEKYLKKAKEVIERLIEKHSEVMTTDINRALKTKLEMLKGLTPFEYYRILTEGLYYDTDGNAISTENPDGKFDKCTIGGMFSNPLILLDKSEVASARKGDIDWSELHLKNIESYERVWELAMTDTEPVDDNEKKIKEEVSHMTNYYSRFKTKEIYAKYSTAFWTFAIVDENGWRDMDTELNGDSEEWVNTFYEKYIVPMSDDTLITIYECVLQED